MRHRVEHLWKRPLVKLRSATTEDLSAIDGIQRKVILADAAGLYSLEQIEGWTCGKDQTARRGLGVEFSASEIKTVNQGPPDAIFRDATFEVKELYPPERRRHGEYKLELAKAREAFLAEELFEQFSPVDGFAALLSPCANLNSE